MKHCRNCGRQVVSGAAFCRYCGASLSDTGTDGIVRQNSAGQVRKAVPVPSVPVSGRTLSPENVPSQNRASGGFGIKKTLALVTAAAIFAVTAFGYPGFLVDKDRPGKKPLTTQQTSGKPSENTGGTGNSGNGQGSSAALRSENAKLTEGSPETTLCGVSINAELLDFPEGGLDAVVVDQGSGSTDDGREIHRYDIRLGGEHEVGGPVELSFPCDDPLHAVVTHYDSETDSWLPMITLADTENSTVTAFTSSFTPFNVEKLPENGSSGDPKQIKGILEGLPDDPKAFGPLYHIKDPGSPQMTYEISSDWVNILGVTAKPDFTNAMQRFTKSPSSYKLIIPEIPSDGTPEQMMTAIEGAGTWWGLISPFIDVGVSLTPMEKAPLHMALVDGRFATYDANFKTQLSNAMTDISLLTMGLQVCMDSYRYGFDSPTTALNAYKNLISNAGTLFSMYTGYTSSALTIGFLGVSIFAMQLDYMVEGAKQAQVEITEDIFNTYYKEIRPFDWKPWYDLFVNRFWVDMDARAAMDEVNRRLDQYAEEFWALVADGTHEDFIFAVSESKYRNFYDIPQEEKDRLSFRLKIDTRKRFRKEVLPRIERFLIERSQEQLYKACARVTEPFNRKLNFTIKENVDMTTTAKPEYLGCAMAFGKNGRIIDAEGWVLEAPSSKEWEDGWTVEFTATDLAWMCADLPDTLYVYKDMKALINGEDPILEKPFELNTKRGDRNTVIDLSGSSTYTWVLTELEVLDKFENSPASEEMRAQNAASGDGEVLDLWFQERHYVITGPGQIVDFPEQFEYEYLFDPYDEEYRYQAVAYFRDGHDGKEWNIQEDQQQVWDSSIRLDSEKVYPNGQTAIRFHGGNVVPQAAKGKRITIIITAYTTLTLYEYTAVPVDEAGEYRFIWTDTHSRQ